MRFLSGLLAVLLFCTPVMAESGGRIVVDSAKMSTGTSDIAVPLTTTVYTKSIHVTTLASDRGMAVMYKSDVATGDTVIAMEQSYTEPATEGSSDNNYVVTNTLGEATDGVWHIATVDTVSMPYIRFKLTGSGSNPATTTIQIKVAR